MLLLPLVTTPSAILIAVVMSARAVPGLVVGCRRVGKNRDVDKREEGHGAKKTAICKGQLAGARDKASSSGQRCFFVCRAKTEKFDVAEDNEAEI